MLSRVVKCQLNRAVCRCGGGRLELSASAFTKTSRSRDYIYIVRPIGSLNVDPRRKEFVVKATVTVPRLLCVVALVAIAGVPLQVQTRTIYWQSGTGNLTDPNYTDLTNTGLTPAADDVVYIGNSGVADLSGTTANLFRLRVGHNETGAPTGLGTVNVTNGAVINLTGGASGTANAGLAVGSERTGTLVIDGAGSSVISSQLIVIGTAVGQLSRSGTIEVKNGGSLISSAGNINMGLGSGNGMPGHLIVNNGTVTALGTGADLNIGQSNATSTFTMTGGSVQIADVVEVASNGSKILNASTFTISGGDFSNGGNFFVGRGLSTGATVNISGGTVTVGNRFLMGGTNANNATTPGNPTGIKVNHSAGSLNTTLDLRVADAASADAPTDSTYNLSGTGVINSTTGGFVGRQGTGKFIQTGGQANFLDALSIGNREGAVLTANGLYKISAGELKAGAGLASPTMALNIAPKGTGEFRVVGDDATIDVLGLMSLGNTVDGVGTLAFEFEAGDLLSRINATGATTFALGSKLVLDTTNAMRRQRPTTC